MRVRENLRRQILAQLTKHQPHKRAERQHGRKYATGRSGRIAKRPQHMAQQEEQKNLREETIMRQRIFGDVFTAADPIRRPPGDKGDAGADQCSAGLYAYLIKSADKRQRSENGPIIKNREPAEYETHQQK